MEWQATCTVGIVDPLTNEVLTVNSQEGRLSFKNTDSSILYKLQLRPTSHCSFLHFFLLLNWMFIQAYSEDIYLCELI